VGKGRKREERSAGRMVKDQACNVCDGLRFYCNT
jgi:hypothetical protein